MPRQSEPECTCPAAPATGYDPSCYYHGEEGTMVVEVNLAKLMPPAPERRVSAPTRPVPVDEVRGWLVNLQEQGYLPTWAADAFDREFGGASAAVR